MAKALTQEQKEKKNRRAKARRINTKIEENGYVPDPQEKKLLMDEGFVFEEPSEEVKAEIEEEMNDMDALVVSRVKAMEEREAVVIDGEIMEITGKLVDFTVLASDEGEILIEDMCGVRHQVKVGSKGNVWSVFYQMDSKTYLNGISEFMELNGMEQEEEIRRLIAKEKTIVFRTENVDGENWLWAPVSLKYQKRKIEDLLPMVREMFAGADIEVLESSGKHGGFASFSVSEDDLMMSRIEIDGGWLDGGHSIRISGCGQILACANMLQMDIQGMVKDILPNFSFGVKQVHSGDDEAFREGLNLVSAEIDTFREICTDAKEITLTPSQIEDILEFYRQRNFISKKVKTILDGKHEDEDIQQVPGTLWGLAMIVTYVGTHEDLSPGVKASLRRMGGELLIVSQAFSEFLNLVKETILE